MSLDKAIEHGKEHRKQYYGAKAVDSTCRPHGGCPWCEGNRLHKHQRRMGVYDSIVTGLTEAIDYEKNKTET